ncbi:MAG TPA: hypothetical protein VFQ60_01240, partial [Patescibacteria group bacterium]|nr:hypothetical protein [Patescibacteria group bacterium]
VLSTDFLEKCAEIFKVNDIPEVKVMLPTVLEYNVLGNLYYPFLQNGDHSNDEWFLDQYDLSRYLNGTMDYLAKSSMDELGIGFRLIVHLPS